MNEQNQWWTQFEQAHTNCGDGPANNIQIHCSHVLALLRERNRYQEALQNFQAWIEFKLDGEIKYRQTGRDPKTNGYSYVEIPEWDMRQKLQAVRMDLDGITEQDIEDTRNPQHYPENR